MKFLPKILSAFTLLAGLHSTAVSAETPQKPNFIIIFTDDHGYADLGVQGAVTDIRTPATDTLATQGVRFTDGYVTAPQCVPSRAGLLSGRYQTRFNLESNQQFQADGGLDGFNEQKTIAEHLREAGYRTGMAGKWHLGPPEEIGDHGFEKFLNKNSGRTPIGNFTSDGKDVPVGKVDTEQYHIEANTETALSFIRRFGDEPFFFYLAYRAPHVPLDVTQKYLDRFPGEMPERRRKALAMISAMDDGVQAITSLLKEKGLEENTLIFYIGDNGAPLKIHKPDEPGGGPGWDGSLNDPLVGEKGMLTEGGIRVPFVASWPGVIPEGTVYTRPVISLDVAATVLSQAGLTVPSELDGVDLIPYLTGEKKGDPHEALFWRWEGQSAVRSGDWKLLLGDEREYLFNLAAEGEPKNVIADHADEAKRLRGLLETWAAEQTPPGLEKAGMTSAAKDYFDYYLHGVDTRPGLKTPPETRTAKEEEEESDSEPRPRLGILKKFDLNKDDKLTFKEYVGDRPNPPIDQLKKRFQRLDTNEDGFLDKSEVVW